MPKSKFFKSVGLKIIVCSAASTVVCLGLCQAGFYLGRNIHDGGPSTLDTIGGIGFLLSLLGVFVGIFVAIVETITSASRGDKL